MPRFLSLAEAVEDCVRDGDTVAMEGFTHLIPMPPVTRSSASGGTSETALRGR